MASLPWGHFYLSAVDDQVRHADDRRQGELEFGGPLPLLGSPRG